MAAAYHTNIETLGGHWVSCPEQRLAQSLRFALDGHLPYADQIHACARFVSEQVGFCQFERRMTDALSFDINPLMVMASQIKSPTQFLAAFNTYNKYSPLAAKTYLTAWNHQGLKVARDASQLRGFDLAPARDSTQLCAEVLLHQVKQHHQKGYQTLLVESVAELTYRVGLAGTLTHDAAAYFDAYPGARVQELSKALGCSSRTLVRWFSTLPFTAVQLKQVCMLTHATRTLASNNPLSVIAADSGFSDLAHFSRVFKKAVGVPPSLMRQALIQ